MADHTFTHNVVIITGASSGIGRALALELAAQGAKLALAGRDVARLEAVADECRARGGEATPIPTDVTDPDACRLLIECTVGHYGRLDTLINNAGISMWGRVERLADVSIIEQVIRVNLMGSIYCTYYALPHLKASRGRLVAISSLTGKIGAPGVSGYAASKHALAGFFDSLRIELADSGVSVTVAYPGFVESEIRQRALGIDGKPLGARARPIPGLMSAEECAHRIIRAAARRRREVVMTAYGQISLWLRLIAPGLLDRLSARFIRQGR